MDTTTARLASHLIVGLGTAYLLRRLLGPRAGIAGALVMLTAHALLDARVATALTHRNMN
jgi:hypothetical protein